MQPRFGPVRLIVKKTRNDRAAGNDGSAASRALRVRSLCPSPQNATSAHESVSAAARRMEPLGAHPISLHESRNNRRDRNMFKGLTRSLAIIAALLVAFPALMLWAAEGNEWLEKMGKMSPIF
jgi:hypothetical protein